MNNNKCIVFMDLEAESAKEKQRSKAELLQLSGIKTLNGKIVKKFNEYCFNKRISKRISNLLKKERDWFDKEKFKSPKEVYKLFYEFSKGCQIYNFGNFDSLVFKTIYKKYFKKYSNIKLIHLKDFKNQIENKIKIKNLSLINIAKILNINIKKEHDALQDSMLLFKIFKKVNNPNFNLNEYKIKRDLIRFCPKLTSTEFVNFKLNNNEYSIKKKYNLVCINLNQITRCENNNIQIDNDIFISDSLNNEIDKFFEKKYFDLQIKINVIDDKLNIIEDINFNTTYQNKEDIDYSKIEILQNIIKKFENDIFLCNTNILINFSKIWNRQFYFVTNKLNWKNREDLKNIKKQIDSAIKEFF